MERKYVDCKEQEFPGGPICDAHFSADSEKELIEEAGRHAINVHGHANTESLREHLRSMIREGTPQE